MNRPSLPLALIAILFAATACPKDTVSRLRGHFVAPPEIDFGDVQVGSTITRVIEVSNDGEARLDDVAIAIGSNFEASTHTFSVTPRMFALGTGETTKVTVSFSPSQVTSEVIESSFTIDSNYQNDNSDGTVKLTVVVKGRGIMQGLTVDPNPVDFGTVLVGSFRDATITITNHETNPIQLMSTLDMSGHPVIERVGGTGRFEVVSMIGMDGSIAGTGMSLGAQQSVMLTLRYVPDVALAGESQDRGRWLLTCSDGHCGASIVLTGHGTTAAIECSPALVAFGKVNPDVTLTKSVSCKNVADQTIQVTSWALDQGTAQEFTLGDNPPGAVALEPNEAVDLNLRFTPTMATLSSGQERTGTLSVYSRADNPPRMLQTIVVHLSGKAGGPTIDVSPAMLSFGQVAVGTQLTRRVLVQNTGYDTLTVSALNFVDPVYSTLELVPFTLQPGDAKLVEVTFAPLIEAPVTSTLLITSDDVGKPEVTVTLFGEGVVLPPCNYVLAPASVEFGAVVLPHSVNQAVRIDNIGTNDCLVRDVAINGADDFHLKVGQELDFRVAPGESKEIGVYYAPMQVGATTGELGFYISDPLASFPSVPMSGTALDTGLLVTPDEIIFGEVAVGCSTANRTITIYNLGATTAAVDRIEVVDTSTTVSFILSGLPVLPISIDPGHTLEFQVSFMPETAQRARNAYVHVVEHGHNDPYVVALYGTTSANPMNEETYVQAESAQVDILFVVDNSCSMGVFQASLAANFSSFIHEAVVQAYDYHMSVVTHDQGDETPGFDCSTQPAMRPAGMPQGKCGYFADGDPMFTNVDPAWKIITPLTQPSVEEAFNTIAVQGSIGAGIERGLEGAYQALTPPKINGWNAGFLRPDASLAIIVVTDDDDDGPDIPIARQRPDYANFYLNFFRSIKGFGDPTRFIFSAIINPPTPDLGPTCFTEGPGFVYADYAQRTGGTIASICPGVDWSVSLANLGQTVFGYRSQFNLLNVPVQSSIEVTVNDMPVVPVESTGLINWGYDFASNSVRFTPATIPEPGSKIVIRYVPLCQ